MNVLCAFPEQPPEEPSSKRRGRTPAVLVAVLMSFLLVFALIFAFPFLISPPVQRLISFNWSGYTVASDLNNPQPEVTSVNASWIVPTIKVSLGNSFCATWVGIGGQFDDETLIQAGTEQDSISGRGTYYAWYELSSAGSVRINSLSVSSGDLMTVSISLSDPATNRWLIEIRDITEGRSFQKSFAYASSRLSAEWIVERPTVNTNLSTLANFGQITFAGCTATVSSKVGSISSFPYIRVTMDNRQNTEIVSASTLTSNGSSFTVSYID